MEKLCKSNHLRSISSCSFKSPVVSDSFNRKEKGWKEWFVQSLAFLLGVRNLARIRRKRPTRTAPAKTLDADSTRNPPGRSEIILPVTWLVEGMSPVTEFWEAWAQFLCTLQTLLLSLADFSYLFCNPSQLYDEEPSCTGMFHSSGDTVESSKGSCPRSGEQLALDENCTILAYKS